MGLFDFLKKKERKPQNNLVNRILSSFMYGRPLFSETDFSSQLRAYKNWTYVASSRNASSFAQVPLRLYLARPSKSKKSRFQTRELKSFESEKLLSNNYVQKLSQVKKASVIEEVLDHPYYDLMKNVNNFTNGFDLFEMTQLHQELTGNAFWYIMQNKLGVPQEIWIMPPDKVFPIPDPQKFISGYEFENGFNNRTFKESEVIHFKMPNPRNPYYGLSPLCAAMDDYTINEYMAKYEQSMFKNMGRLGGVFETDESIDEEDFERLRQQIQETFTGVGNVGKVPLLDKGLKYKDYGLKPTEMSFIEGRERVKETILNCYGQNLALYDKSSTRANADAANVGYMRSAIRPRCIRFAEKLNEKLIPRYDEYLFVSFDECTPEDSLQAAKIREMHLRSGLTDVNEEREKIRLASYPFETVPLVQVQNVPLDRVLAGETLTQYSGNKDNKINEESVKQLADIVAKKVFDEMVNSRNN